jgi:hypothetical protein
MGILRRIKVAEYGMINTRAIVVCNQAHKKVTFLRIESIRKLPLAMFLNRVTPPVLKNPSLRRGNPRHGPIYAIIEREIYAARQ